MPADQTAICNSALVNVGSDRISAITQDVRRAQLLNAIWDQSRDYVLSAHPWNFALKRTTLTPTADTPEWGYQYEYDLPNDFLGIWQTDPEDIEFNIESDSAGSTNKLRTDETSLDILYIWSNSNWATWSPSFAEALGWYLSSKIAYALMQSLALQDSCYKKYAKCISDAKGIDGSQGTMRTLESTSFVDARLSSAKFNGQV